MFQLNMHHVLRADEIRPRPAYPGSSNGFSRYPLVDGAAGSVHMGVGMCALDAGSSVRRDEGQMELGRLTAGAAVDEPTVSASMATALLAYSGFAVKVLVDQRLDAQLHTMFMVEYEPGGVAHPHDHPLEEAYMILEGEVEAHADGEVYTLHPGDAFWTAVGCVHAFYNRTDARVRWLETQ